MARVYHWKHGWIPLDHVALNRGGHPTQAQGPIAGASKTERSLHHPHPETGIKNRRQLAQAITRLPSIPDAQDKRHARDEVRAAAVRLKATDLLPGNVANKSRSTSAHVTTTDGRRINTGIPASPRDNVISAAGQRQADLARLAAGNPGSAAVNDQRVAARQAARRAVPAGPTVGSPPSRTDIARHTALGDKTKQDRADLAREAQFGATPGIRAAATRALAAHDRVHPEAAPPATQAQMRQHKAADANIVAQRFAADVRTQNAIAQYLATVGQPATTGTDPSSNARSIIKQAGLDPLKILKAFHAQQARRRKQH